MRTPGVFAGRLAAVTVGAGIVVMGMVVLPGEGILDEAGPAQLLSSARVTIKNKSDRVCFLSAKRIFIEEISWMRVCVISIFGLVGE